MKRVSVIRNHLRNNKCNNANTNTRHRVLIANRGEIAIRISEAAFDLGFEAVAIYSPDDANSLHRSRATSSVELRNRGPNAYLDIEEIINIAVNNQCTLVHPGYGFLSENPQFARACRKQGLLFVGPSEDSLVTFGNKQLAKQAAITAGVPVIEGCQGAATEIISLAKQFYSTLVKQRGRQAKLMVKAVDGGGGRGMRIVSNLEQIESAILRCQSESRKLGGSGEVIVEECIQNSKHVEVQVLGDGEHVMSIGERDCSIQRQQQKMLEIAPCPGLKSVTRAKLFQSAVNIMELAKYSGAGTVEFLVNLETEQFWFLEVNPRLQVEHTITETLWSHTGLDIVQAQFQIALGIKLGQFQWKQFVDNKKYDEPAGFAVQLRVCAEQLVCVSSNSTDSNHTIVSAPPKQTGPISVFIMSNRKGVRVHSHAYNGYSPNLTFDSLLLKLVIHHQSATQLRDAIPTILQVLSDTNIQGVSTNIPFLVAVLRQPAVQEGIATSQFIDLNAKELAESSKVVEMELVKNQTIAPEVQSRSTDTPMKEKLQPDVPAVRSPMSGIVESIENVAATNGGHVNKGELLLVLSAMKMEHEVRALETFKVKRVLVHVGEQVEAEQVLLEIEPIESSNGSSSLGMESMNHSTIDLDNYSRKDLREVQTRHEIATNDSAYRTAKLSKRLKRTPNLRTARQNIECLCDPNSFIEYGQLTIAAQKSRRSKEDLIHNTPADGMIAGIGTVNGCEHLVPHHHLLKRHGNRPPFSCVVLSYDYLVLAGTQGYYNHIKKDRLLELAHKLMLPVILYAEGGGGRPGDTDVTHKVASLDVNAFRLYAGLSGLVPTVCIVSGRCFAGNAALAGMSDCIIMTKGSNLGMGGPAMVLGGGLGTVKAEEIGPVNVHHRNGVADIVVSDEAEATRIAKQYLSYFQGHKTTWNACDQRLLRTIVPENRKRSYNIKDVINTTADEGSVLYLRDGFGVGLITALIRIEGIPIGVMANNPQHLGGAIDRDGSDKAARFMQLLDAHGLPILFLCDTPGMMVGPAVEADALVRHCSRLFVTAASLTVPYFTIVLRKSYGLGAQAMGGGNHKSTTFTVSWPSGEFGAMGLEGGVRLGYSKELAAESDLTKREHMFETMVEKAYDHGKALSAAEHFEVDDVIDPMDTRFWLVRGLESSPVAEQRLGEKRRTMVDTW